ncbi:MAG: DUF357 domain-containing protein [Candidatus Altiarchaeales archaeon]|nr:DUF357 domain-containing protein [Candidatus Altiarchaeota archaeon]MCG2781986.1 DUF357 domain-containing protein [Candidatus Altiarchaeales archaeon]MBU4266963.1 DUF357 domain-containing protein [Candidatus Altiarchaeota archaeon]MBU4341599.1 DUF357 domain-containing protein [Candidatus Altiarchaeota archaeon]MBU4406754.1 DUF357 domain-containing protein [Candidatus Altiarchaeota archaeon]
MEEIKQKIDDYLRKAEPLFRDIEIQTPSKIDLKKVTGEFKQMALAYYNDAKHFYEVGEYANALAALEYAEGWLDAGKRLGIFK